MRAPLAHTVWLVWFVAGCTGITVHRVQTRGMERVDSPCAVATGELSAPSALVLRQLDLEQLYHRHPPAALARLQEATIAARSPDRLFALAEMSYLLGREAERSENAEAVAYYYGCAGYAYHYLFDPEVGVDVSSPETAAPRFDPRFRGACDLYNAGLAKCIRAAQRRGQLDPSHELFLATPDGEPVHLSVVHDGFAWPPSEFGPLRFCADYLVEGLPNQYHRYGLGVPLIGTLVTAADTPSHLFYPKHVNFPVTAFFRFDGSLADLHARRCGRLELHNPLARETVTVRCRPVPLEADLTTPLAYFLSRTDLNGIEYEGFLRADRVQRRTGIYLFEPYQRGKIPVLMVHGLLSSPLTWAPLFNDLRADPELREHFQFWFYLYPTANPYLVTAADLRQTLADLRAELDPQRQDPALDHLVLVGHSMGGLVSQLLTVDSGNAFWDLVSKQPLDTLPVHPETKEELRRIFFFEREQGIDRVVFIATPHHGSRLSPALPGRLLTRLARVPKSLMRVAQDVARASPTTWSQLQSGHLPTSVDLLSPGSPALEILAAETRPAGVHYHSIIGIDSKPNPLVEIFLPDEDSTQGSDGVVPYTSAHLDRVDSEILVPADHTHVHQHPICVAELKRILREQYETVFRQATASAAGR